MHSEYFSYMHITTTNTCFDWWFPTKIPRDHEFSKKQQRPQQSNNIDIDNNNNNDNKISEKVGDRNK